MSLLLSRQALADMVTAEDLAAGRLYPPLNDIRKCSLKIATYIAEHAYTTGKIAANILLLVPNTLFKCIITHRNC